MIEYNKLNKGNKSEEMVDRNIILVLLAIWEELD